MRQVPEFRVLCTTAYHFTMPNKLNRKMGKIKFNKDFLRFIPSFGRACTLKIRQEWTKNLLHMKYVPSITRKNTQNFGYPTTWSITNIHPSGRLLREKPTQFIQHIWWYEKEGLVFEGVAMNNGKFRDSLKSRRRSTM